MADRIDWREAEPALLDREQRAMALRASEMAWSDDFPAGGWTGLAPAWPIDRDPPKGLDRLLEGRRLRLAVAYTQGFPMAPPTLIPIEPEPRAERRADHRWHLNGDGSICLLFSAADWPERATACDVVEKAAGWFVEYLAMEAGLIERMSESGPLAGNPELEAALLKL